MHALVVSFPSCLDERSSQGGVALAVPGTSTSRGGNVGLCKSSHLDDVRSMMAQHLHAQCLSSARVAESGVLGPSDAGECRKDAGGERACLPLDLSLLQRILSQNAHEAFGCITIILFVAGAMHTPMTAGLRAFVSSMAEGGRGVNADPVRGLPSLPFLQTIAPNPCLLM